MTETPKPRPAEDVTLDLDTLEREGTKEPFSFRHNGKRYMMSDPAEMDWQDQLQAIANPVFALRHLLPADDVESFFEAKIPGWKLEAVVANFRKHYALPSLGEAPGSSA